MQRIWTDAYSFDPETKEYLGKIRAFASPADLQRGKEIYHLPGNSTFKEPPECSECQKQVFDPWMGEWTIVDDFRQMKFWNIQTKELMKLKLGEVPDHTLTEEEPDVQSEFDGQRWVQKPADTDPLRPLEWSEENKKWQKKALPVQGSEIATELKRQILSQNVFALNITQKLAISGILNKYIDLLSFSGDVSRSDYETLITELMSEIGRKVTIAKKNILKDSLENWLSDKQFSS